MTYSDIISAIQKHIDDNFDQYEYDDFYIGITDNINERLFGFHKVNKESDWWVYCPADSEDVARKVEKYFLDLGMDGDTGGGANPTYVYCYEITDTTIER